LSKNGQKNVKVVKKSAKSSVSRTATISTQQKKVTFCHVFTT
jgi:hypothetical protein